MTVSENVRFLLEVTKFPDVILSYDSLELERNLSELLHPQFLTGLQHAILTATEPSDNDLSPNKIAKDIEKSVKNFLKSFYPGREGVINNAVHLLLHVAFQFRLLEYLTGREFTESYVDKVIERVEEMWGVTGTENYDAKDIQSIFSETLTKLHDADELLEPRLTVTIEELTDTKEREIGRQKRLIIQHGDTPTEGRIEFVIEKKIVMAETLNELAAETVVKKVKCFDVIEKWCVPKELKEGILSEKWGEFQWMQDF